MTDKVAQKIPVPARAETAWHTGRVPVLTAMLVLVVLVAFAPVVHNEFLSYDDKPNLVKNPWVQQGLSFETLRWAFTSVEFQNWHPLTWISHILDISIFGLWAGGHHAVSGLIHAANTALLFLVFRAMTGAFWRSALVAALFGLHPLRVESVAWASERKDVLTLLFGLCALGAYLRYLRRRSAGSYAAAIMLTACALMSKPMLVTFPAILLLLDLWPLNRWLWVRGWPVRPGHGVLLEKIPFLSLSLAVSLVTYFAQARGAMGHAIPIPLGARIGNAFVSYAAYLGKTVWPAKLAVFYPHFWQEVPWWKPAGGATFLGVVTFFTILVLRHRPAWFVGWAWYLGALVPVIGIIQVGSQSLADRYTYIPQIGVLLAISWGLADLAAVSPLAKKAILAAVPTALAALGGATWVHVTYWRTTETIFAHAVAVTKDNYLALSQLGAALADQGRVAEGSELIARALRITPGSRVTLFIGSGDHYARRGMAREAAEAYKKALEIEPDRYDVREKLQALGDLTSAAPSVPALDPHRRGSPHDEPYARGNLLAHQGRFEEAVTAYREAVAADPGNYEAWHTLGCALGKLGRTDEAVAALEETLRLKPNHLFARKNLELIRDSARGAVQ